MDRNDEMTLKIPRVVHRTLKQLAANMGIPMYALIARLVLREFDEMLSNNNEKQGKRSP